MCNVIIHFKKLLPKVIREFFSIMEKQPLLSRITSIPSYTDSIEVPITIQPTAPSRLIEITGTNTIVNTYDQTSTIPVTILDQCPGCVLRRTEKQRREAGSNNCCYGPSLCYCDPGVSNCSSNDGEAVIIVAIVCAVCMLIGCCVYFMTEVCDEQEDRCSTCGNVIECN